MREILFKGKRKDSGEWVEGSLFADGEKSFILCDHEIDCMDGENADFYATEWYEVDPKTVCQYTGLHDRYGTMVWENDIVDIIDYDEEHFKVSWSERDGLFEMIGQGITTDFSSCYSEKDVTVIGNVFDDSEVLK